MEGRLGNEHTHKDGNKGRDAYVAKVSYRDGKNIDEEMQNGIMRITTMKKKRKKIINFNQKGVKLTP